MNKVKPRGWRVVRKFFLVLMLLAAIASGVLAPLAEVHKPHGPQGINKLLFFPDRYPNGDWTPGGVIYEDVYFASEDNTRLHGWFCRAEDPVATILFAHGNAGHIASRLAILRHLQSVTNVSVFIFDYRGYGRSSGTPTVEGVLQDARAARATLRRLANIADSEMLLMGESIGGAIAVQLAAESSPRALILQSTFSSLRDVAEVHYSKQASMVSRSMLDSETQITRFQGTLFQSHGDRDRTIPYALGDKLFRAANEPKEFIAIVGADHNNWLTEDYLARLDEFIRRVSGTNRSIPNAGA